MTDGIPPARMKCPTCGETSRIITRGDSRGTIVSACCEAVIPEKNDEPAVLVEDGKLVCPYGDCGATNQIFELDVATRSNHLVIDDEETSAIKACTGDSSFETDGYECDGCARAVALPDGYEVIQS
ncbi:hypothetical protein ACQPYK_49595 (plasmid) [Streptosporangium sp. CA-135522]|uniref:hypothetical protein n=1 Tax=Streptosporangium sp. CA-135522 TaxID=3240072 RepID=UPI003D8D9E2F